MKFFVAPSEELIWADTARVFSSKGQVPK